MSELPSQKIVSPLSQSGNYGTSPPALTNAINERAVEKTFRISYQIPTIFKILTISSENYTKDK
ncbi:CLUMA_CG003084, isoform A [Clunio marinus]|uniref:CLUMA_CG003084, isoform A n=1 Tax=Clunio marinus TaxID=568069 RepID=A0A1J1HMQ0_9DIPT|nr:CLUMA_CG003084, isoform A [Clunio marinus]